MRYRKVSLHVTHKNILTLKMHCSVNESII